MDRAEELMDEYRDQLNFEFRSDMPDNLSGLIVGNNVYINEKLDEKEKYLTLAEEIGHYETSTTKNITNYSLNRKEELQARRWGYKKIVPIHLLKKYTKMDEVFLYEIADELNLPEHLIKKSIEVYKLEGKL